MCLMIIAIYIIITISGHSLMLKINLNMYSCSYFYTIMYLLIAYIIEYSESLSGFTQQLIAD